MASQPVLRTPRELCGTNLCPRDARGQLLPIDARRRFADKCQFDPATGCVIWIGGTTQGRGNTAVYGSFWDGGRRWSAHRWSGVHIHGLDLDGVQAGHTCPHGPNTLCVQHVAAQTQLENLAEMHTRRAQTATERQYWLFVQLGLERAPETQEAPVDAVPFYSPPVWLQPYLPPAPDCPF